MKLAINSLIFVIMEETQRQKKIAALIRKDLADMLQRDAKEGGLKGILISVSKVMVTPDLSLAKIHISIFPGQEATTLLQNIQDNRGKLRHDLAQRTRHQLRRVPELRFFLDDSLDYIKNIEASIKAGENPIKNPDLLDPRKKS